jgi:hypothetical protein
MQGGRFRLSKKSRWDFFDTLHNASIFRMLLHPENLPLRGAKAYGVLQALDSKRRGAAPSHSSAKTGGVCLHFSLSLPSKISTFDRFFQSCRDFSHPPRRIAAAGRKGRFSMEVRRKIPRRFLLKIAESIVAGGLPARLGKEWMIFA